MEAEWMHAVGSHVDESNGHQPSKMRGVYHGGRAILAAGSIDRTSVGGWAIMVQGCTILLRV